MAFIWPFSLFENLAFFETAYGQIWPFYFLGPGNPASNALLLSSFFCVVHDRSKNWHFVDKNEKHYRDTNNGVTQRVVKKVQTQFVNIVRWPQIDSTVWNRVVIWPLKKDKQINIIRPFGLFSIFKKKYLFRPILDKFQQNIQHLRNFKISLICFGK